MVLLRAGCESQDMAETFGGLGAGCVRLVGSEPYGVGSPDDVG